MSKDMLNDLVEYFKRNGFDRSKYISDPNAPHPYREVRREFKNFEIAVAEAKKKGAAILGVVRNTANEVQADIRTELTNAMDEIDLILDGTEE